MANVINIVGQVPFLISAVSRSSDGASLKKKKVKKKSGRFSGLRETEVKA